MRSRVEHLGIFRRQLVTMMHSMKRPAQDHLSDMRKKRDEYVSAGGKMDDDDYVMLVLQSLPTEYRTIVSTVSRQTNISIYEVEKAIEQEELILKRFDKQVVVEKDLVLNVRTKPNWKNSNSKPKETRRCFKCDKVGHLKQDCRSNRKEWTKESLSAVKTASSEYFFVTASNEFGYSSWILDSGATSHICREKNMFAEMKDIPKTDIILAGRNDKGEPVCISAKQQGSVELLLSNWENDKSKVTLTNVYYVPEATTNIVSVRRITSAGGSVKFDGNGFQLLSPSSKIITEGRQHTSGVYLIQPELPKMEQVNASYENKDSLGLWHRRFGHINFESIKLLAKGSVRGMTINDARIPDVVCSDCLVGKQHRLPFKNAERRAGVPLQLVHSDICGPMQTTSIGGKRYFVLFIDDASRYTWCYFMVQKSEVYTHFVAWKTLVENQLNRKLKILRTDNGMEYLSNDMKCHLSENGIRHELTVPYTPQQNGVAERANRTHVERARCMLSGGKLGNQFWTAAVATSVYLGNRSITRNLPKGKTPYECLNKRKPSVIHLKTFGCVGYVHIDDHSRKKFDSKSVPCRFIGYSETSKAYLLWHEEEEKIVISRDVIFDEKCFQNRQELKEHNQDIDKNCFNDNDFVEEVSSGGSSGKVTVNKFNMATQTRVKLNQLKMVN